MRALISPTLQVSDTPAGPPGAGTPHASASLAPSAIAASDMLPTQMALAIPQVGRDKEEILRAMTEMRSADAGWRAGRTFSLVYYAGDAHDQFLKQAHALFFAEN